MDAKAQFRSLAEPWADTGTSTWWLMTAVLGGLAEVERDLIRTLTAEGRSRAQKRGQHMGRRPKLTPAQKAEARSAPRAGRYAPRTRPELQRRHIHHSPRDASRMSIFIGRETCLVRLLLGVLAPITG